MSDRKSNAKKKSIITTVALAGALALAGCTSDADTASYNLSREAEQFNIERRITFINGITNEIMLTVEGYCSVETADSGLAGALEVTCKQGPDQYTKDFLGLSDNVTYITEQLESKDVSLYHRKIIIKPESIFPEFDLEAGEQ
ncbi:beta-sandwich lipoprotein [Microbacterium sp. No. 7]|uniref:beta-sandwich lipoprotein n=1 Tax=Microbacterium sp. No. 7 TaxID=1714373 RepID=UPI0006D1989D|nr:hypothetical protein [Microbacterium sp. No. 7]ALJ22072.1 hypothetical protein AOA12_20135 [Microbacterium sp. No. 7]